MYCPKCGVQNIDEANFCKECGQELVAKAVKHTGNASLEKNVVLKRILGIVLAFLSFFIGIVILGGILGILLGVAAGSWCLKHFGVVSENSMWVSETEGVKKAKYILLVAVVITICVFVAYIYLP